MRLAQRLDQLGRVGRRDQDRAGGRARSRRPAPALRDGVEVGRALENQFDAKRIGSRLRAPRFIVM